MLLRTGILVGFLVNNNRPPPPLFFISVPGSVGILVKVGVPQAVEVVGKAEEQGLANLDR